MAKKKACKTCKVFVEGDVCQICKRDAFTTSWQGRMIVVDASRSFIAKQMGINDNDEFAIKVR